MDAGNGLTSQDQNCSVIQSSCDQRESEFRKVLVQLKGLENYSWTPHKNNGGRTQFKYSKCFRIISAARVQ